MDGQGGQSKFCELLSGDSVVISGGNSQPDNRSGDKHGGERQRMSQAGHSGTGHYPVFALDGTDLNKLGSLDCRAARLDRYLKCGECPVL